MDTLQALDNASERNKPNFRQQLTQRLNELKNDYIRFYSALYAKARLTLSEDKRKGELLRDERLEQLQALSTIDILPSGQLNEFRNQLAGLKAASALSEKDLLIDPVPSSADFRPINENLNVAASVRLNQLEDKLEQFIISWTNNLLENLEDPITHDSLGLLDPEDRNVLDDFITAKQLPQPIEQEFVKSLRQVLQGLVPIEISADDIQSALFSEGSASTVEQLKQRLDQFLNNKCKGQDVNKVRIVLK
jgi:plasmid maintenance system killer protein